MAGEEVNHIAGHSDRNHDRCLFPMGLADGEETQSKRRYEEEIPFPRKWVLASSGRSRVLVEEAIKRGSDRDTEAEKERVYYGVEHADRASNDISRLKFEGAAEDNVTGQNQGD